ncbi:Uncharacterised protein [Bacillus freudenreichii]|nr:Uncharacterised protein [Bacillus freudenreichii]
MAVFFLLTALLLIAATIIIGIAYVAIISLRKDLKGILFFVATPIVLLMALTLLLIAISAYIELLSVPVVG